MKHARISRGSLAGVLTIVPATAQRYAARRDGDIVQLTDTATDTRVSIAPSIGNIAFRMIVKGHDVLRWPHADMAAFKANPNQTGIPFMGPWINRLDEQAFYANGKRYPFDMSARQRPRRHPDPRLRDVDLRMARRVCGRRPQGAAVTSRLEFFRQPSWMKQWPFAHTIDMTYRLTNGTLEVETTITNMSAEPMPVSVGFHPYFQLTDSPRDEWTISVGARTHLKLTPNKLPTGETEADRRAVHRRRAAARLRHSTTASCDLVRDEQGRATMTVHRQVAASGCAVRTELSRRASSGRRSRRTSSASSRWRRSPTGSTWRRKGIYKELQTSRPAALGARASGFRRRGF